ncbi:MAG: S41 family peptidase [Rhodospirillales bacterium]|nr:S41 family peptidase [Rhodospirillales bacterium]
MVFRRIMRKTLIITLGIAAGVSLLSSLSGCQNEGASPLRIAADIIHGDEYALSQDSMAELKRFNAVYHKYAIPVSDSRQLKHFSDSFKRVRIRYVRPVSDRDLIDAAIKGVTELNPKLKSVPPAELVESALDAMLTSLDAHSSYLNPQELRETNVVTKGEFGGLGIEVSMENGLVKVISPIADTPADRAGIKPGDLITHTDGAPVQGKTLKQAVRIMRGQPGQAIVLTIKRGEMKPFDVKVVRAVIKVRSVRWRTEGDFGYVQIASFTEKVETGIETAMADIHKKLGVRLKGIVLDLRNNPGGLLDQALALSDAFLEGGRIVSVRGRNAENERVFDAYEGDLAGGLPIVVLINGGSASASEIVASALKDHKRAIVLGARSYGKGSVQTISPLPIEGALRLTTQLYYVPSGRSIQAHGVTPDIRLVSANQKPEPFPREADAPGALPAVNGEDVGPRASVTEENCPAIGEGDKADRQLGCALMLLKSGSTEKFLASVGSRLNM